MNHEILFRGKRVDNGEWAEWFYSTEEFNGATCEIENIPRIQQIGDCVSYGIEPETLGQYTGLTDKNGRKIFEGDVIEYEEKYGIARYSVVWNEKAARFSVAGYNGMIIGDFAFYASNKCEVIGNIHDNLELLGGG